MEKSLKDLTALVEEDLRVVDRLIGESLGGEVSLLSRLTGYIIEGGGKRLRPLLTLACSRLCGYRGEHDKTLAAAIEFIHTATLLHDDVVDESALRRGRESANAIFGNKASILVGDFLFSRAFLLMVETGSLRVLDVLSRASLLIAQGEIDQLQRMNDLGTTRGEYLGIIKNKTAMLFSAACQVGATMMEGREEEEAALASYGLNLGMAFQLVDDALDYTAFEGRLGKSVGDDFREGKVTFPVIVALERGMGGDFWGRVLEDGDQREGDLKEAIGRLYECKAIEETFIRAGEYASRAGEALGIFPESEEKKVLFSTLDLMLTRQF